MLFCIRFITSKIIWRIPILLILLLISSCRKLVEVTSPPTSVNAEIVFSSDASAAAVMTGVYGKMGASPSNIISISTYPELLADNLVLFEQNTMTYVPFYRNSLSPFPVVGASLPDYWFQFYTILYNINSVIENVPDADKLKPALKEQLLGEAYFMRAFSYYYLVNLYGDVPLVLNTNFRESSLMPRTPVAEVYKQIKLDLNEAIKKLSGDYMDATLLKYTTERVRPNKSAAETLLARVHLHLREYADAETHATAVINNNLLYDTVSVDLVFNKNSRETIWAVQPVRVNTNTIEGGFYILPATGPNAGTPVYLSNRLLSLFEPNDKRRSNWVNSVTVTSGDTYNYPYKYKIGNVGGSSVSEYSVMMRYAEVLLVRAEARAEQNNLSDATSDVNILRKRAGITDLGILSKEDLLAAIMKERRLELFTECAHRWFDLKRSGKIDEIMTPVAIEKGGTWKSEWQLFPVADIELKFNPKLVQNPGYPQ